MPATNNINLLSLVIPAYKQEKTILNDIENLDSALSSLPYNYEIIVVVDGFIDKTFENSKKIDKDHIKVFGYKDNEGKGHAVKYGMLRAKGDIVGFIDAGMDINATGISLLLDSMIWNDADIIVGSKLHPDSKRINYPIFRKILSWGYRALTHILFDFNIKDTQVGLKFFRGELVKKVFPKLLVKTFAFDVEILAVSSAMGYKKIYEGPVELNFRGISTISSITSMGFWKIIFFMLWDTAAVFYRLKILNYYKRKNERQN